MKRASCWAKTTQHNAPIFYFLSFLLGARLDEHFRQTALSQTELLTDGKGKLASLALRVSLSDSRMRHRPMLFHFIVFLFSVL